RLRYTNCSVPEEVLAMNRLAQITLLVTVFILLALPAFSDTLVLRNGEKITGYFEGGSERVIKFRASDGVVKEYDLFNVQQIHFGDEKPATSERATTDPRLVPGSQRVTRPTSSNAANTGWTIPTGSKIVIRMIDNINSEKNKIGEPFIAVL